MDAAIFVLLLLTSCPPNLGDKFIGHDCSAPVDIEYIPHNTCRIPTDTLVHNRMVILQDKHVKAVEGHQCTITMSTIISFCGAYSHTKETGESTYSVPQVVPPEKCRQMVASKSFSTNSMSFPIKIGGLNYFNMFTHGSIEMTGNNIICQGAPLRMQNGKMNNNMLRSLHFTISVHKIELTSARGNMIHPEAQTIVGSENDDHGMFKASTIVWHKIDPKECNLLFVGNMQLTSVQSGIFFSNEHKVQFITTNSFHNDKCKLMVLETKQEGIFLADTSQDFGQIHKIDTANVNINAHYSSQLNYLNNKLKAVLQSSFQDDTCHLISRTPISTTSWLTESTFLRNLGDCSIKFKCTQVIVAPNVNTSTCFTRIPVKDINGRTSFLDQSTRILMDHAIPTPCHPSLLPTYKTLDGSIVVYSPGRQEINIAKANNNPGVDDKSGQSGIYTDELINQWFSLAYIQSFAKNSFAYISQSLCEDCDTPLHHPNNMAFIQSQLSKIPLLTPPSFLMGINIEYVGGICSIIVVVLIILNTIYIIATWMIKVCILQRNDVKIASTLARALCTEIFVITKIMSGDEKKEHDNENMI